MPADTRELVYTPRARRDLLGMEMRFARQVLEDLPVVRTAALEGPPVSGC